MSKRSEFTSAGKASALRANAAANVGNIDGVWISEQWYEQKRAGMIYYCENCKFCHTDPEYFDVDHFVPDQEFKRSGSVNASNVAINMGILCKSQRRGDNGCNQRKGSKLDPPPRSGLAFTRSEIDMNCCPLSLRNIR
jgi:hypothetical protein